MVLRLMYEPQELVDTSDLSNEEWLSYPGFVCYCFDAFSTLIYRV